ncbi:MAG: response regulator, partial [Pseudomonadota bacterium]
MTKVLDFSTTEQQPAKIMLVDDDPVMRELAGAKLAGAGYDVAYANNGAEALESLGRDRFDLVISDLDMPVMDGFELTKTVRDSRFYGDLPVIVITGSESKNAVERAFASGATSFLTKPVNWTLFSHSVQFVLRASEDQRALKAARDLAEAGSQFKDSLMSVMSHELRSPSNCPKPMMAFNGVR